MNNKSSKRVIYKKECKNIIKKYCIKIKLINIEEDSQNLNTFITQLNNANTNKYILINKLYNNFYKEIENSNLININDFNYLLLNYTEKDSDFELFKKFIIIKNLFIITLIIKSNIWIDFVEKTKNKIINIINDNNLSKNINSLIEKSIISLLLNFILYFRGCWEIADTKDNKILNLDISDPDHLEYIKNYIIK